MGNIEEAILSFRNQPPDYDPDDYPVQDPIWCAKIEYDDPVECGFNVVGRDRLDDLIDLLVECVHKGRSIETGTTPDCEIKWVRKYNGDDITRTVIEIVKDMGYLKERK